jgi:hypothetical protein
LAWLIDQGGALRRARLRVSSLRCGPPRRAARIGTIQCRILRVRKITAEVILGLVRQLVPSTTIAAAEGDIVRFVPYKDDTMYFTTRHPGSVAVLFAPIPDEEEGGEGVEGT